VFRIAYSSTGAGDFGDQSAVACEKHELLFCNRTAFHQATGSPGQSQVPGLKRESERSIVVAADDGRGIGSPSAGTDAKAATPVDLDHLAQYTAGDPSLEREILNLFCTQSITYLDQLRAATGPKDLSIAAHSLKGSARAVGAWRMARAAEEVETLPEESSLEEREPLIAELEAALNEATAYIARCRGA